MRSALVAVFVGLALCISASAGAAPSRQNALADYSHTYADPIGDNNTNAADISSLTISEASGAISFHFEIANLGPGLVDGDALVVFADTDRDTSTGCEGDDMAVIARGSTYGNESAVVARCVGGDWETVVSARYAYEPSGSLTGPGSVTLRTSSSYFGGNFRFLAGSDYDGDYDSYTDALGPAIFNTGAVSQPSSTASHPRKSKPAAPRVALSLARHPDVRAEATGPGGALVNYAPARMHGAASLSYSKRSGSFFRFGKTTVTVTARGQGKIARTSFTVTVSDTTAPAITPLGNVSTSTAISGATTVTYGPVTAVDAVDKTPLVSCNPQAGTVFPTGPTTVNCNVRDEAGNAASASFPLVVPTLDATHAAQTTTTDTYNAGQLTAASTVLTIPVANDANGNPLAYSWTASSGSIVGIGGTATWTRALAGGQPLSGIVTVTGSDGSSFTITF